MRRETVGWRPRRRAVFATALGLVTLLGTAAWGQPNSEAPAPSSGPARVPASTLDARAALFVDRLAAASGRSLSSLAASVEHPGVPVVDVASPTVAAATAATDKYAETLAQLSAAEEAAAQQLADTESEVKRAQADRARAAADLAEEEEAAARQVDAALEAAIDAARAQALVRIDDSSIAAPRAGVPAGASTGSGEVLALVRKHFPSSEVGNAMAVSRCESGHANRVGKANGNGTRDFGVFQINDGGTLQAALRRLGVGFADINAARELALDPAVNVRLARVIFDSRGWQPWVCAAKVGVIAGLYQRAPGPMYGRFDELGRAL
jgi:hypothetical protein